MPDFVMSARNISGGRFGNSPSTSRYLVVPDNEAIPLPAQATLSKSAWFETVQQAAVWGTDARNGTPRGDALVFVHGFNNDSEGMLTRHRQLKSGLNALGFKGTIVSFDWPSDDSTLGYLDDRHDAKATALQLVDDGIKQLSRLQDTPNCTINVHVLAHSMGAYVLREAFDDADDTKLTNSGWMISQIMLIGADVSQDSMQDDNAVSESLYSHCLRLTNYSNAYDSVLKISNAKRLGLAPRAGRVGLPEDIPQNAINVDCSDYYQQLIAPANNAQFAQDQFDAADKSGLSFPHSFYLANRTVYADIFDTIKGDIDRNRIPTRVVTPKGLSLHRV